MTTNTMKNHFRTLATLPAMSALAACALLTTACGDDDSGPTTVTPTATPTETKPVEDTGVDEKKAEELAYTYDAMNRRDPFKTYFDELVLVEADAQNLTELQRIDLDKLQLTAVVTGTATPMAMVEDGTGRGHTLKIGTLVGKRFGQVKQIKRGEVVIQEEFRDFTGKRIPVYKSLKLSEEEGGQP